MRWLLNFTLCKAKRKSGEDSTANSVIAGVQGFVFSKPISGFLVHDEKLKNMKSANAYKIHKKALEPIFSSNLTHVEVASALKMSFRPLKQLTFRQHPFKFFAPRYLLFLSVVLFLSFQIHFFNSFDYSNPTAYDKVFFHDKSYISEPYKKLLATHKDTLHSLDYHSRCESYFYELYQIDPEWGSTDFAELPHERYIFERKDAFINSKVNELMVNDEVLKQLKDPERKKYIEEQGLWAVFAAEYEKVANSTRITEQRMSDAATNLRVYGACFLDQFGQFNKDRSTTEKATINGQCRDIEIRMFQWLSRRLPIYKRWDGQVFNTIPKMSDFIDQSDLPEYEDNHKIITDCYLKDLRNSFNGKGIVVSAANKHLEQLITLVGALRAVGNKLPIQIVHSGDFTEESQKKLTEIGRSIKDLNLSKVVNIEHIIALRNITVEGVSKDDYEDSEEFVKILFPQQELWFVDVSQVIAKRYKRRFSGYFNKLLAYFFNSFQHSILIDTDTVPAADLDQFILKSSFYKDQGAYFFRDRELQNQNSKSDSQFYVKLMPTTIDQAIFGIPEITDFTLKNRFIGERFSHYMESGVVAIDRIKHFTGVLATIQMLMWSPAVVKVWGDKELFWLGMSMAGDEDYYMNYWAAGSVGQITPQNRRLIDDETGERRNKIVGKELCSIHPAHISSEDNSTLLWFNSGFTVCKFPTAEQDFNSGFLKNLFDTPADLAEMYNDYQRMDSIIIPKSAEYYINGVPRDENSRGWEKKGDVCKGFMWCAYDMVGGVDDPVSNGKLIQFDEASRKSYRYYGSVSVNANMIFEKKE